MNRSFLYKADSKELWLVMEKPFDCGCYNCGVRANMWQNRLHYTVSPELHELLKDRKGEIKENEFQVKEVFQKNENYDTMANQNRDNPIIGYRSKIAIPLPEQKKPCPDQEVNENAKQLYEAAKLLMDKKAAVQAETLIDFIIKKFVLCDGDFYSIEDKEGDSPLDAKDILKIFKAEGSTDKNQTK